jgi:hypothetical protein
MIAWQSRQSRSPRRAIYQRAVPASDADNGVTCSMSRSSYVCGNAAMKSVFSLPKTERTSRKACLKRNHARHDVDTEAIVIAARQSNALVDPKNGAEQQVAPSSLALANGSSSFKQGLSRSVPPRAAIQSANPHTGRRLLNAVSEGLTGDRPRSLTHTARSLLHHGPTHGSALYNASARWTRIMRPPPWSASSYVHPSDTARRQPLLG